MPVKSFQLQIKELAKADSEERMNIFRRYFASSRYKRLLIQQLLVRSAADKSLEAKVKELEVDHNNDFSDAVKAIKKSDYFEEFLAAVKEEDEALQKIIEAYDKRMNRGT
jgi:transcription termination factor NusB